MKKRYLRYKDIYYAVSRLEKLILDTLDFDRLVNLVVDSLLFELGYLRLGYKIVVLGLIDKKKKVLRRVAISHTKEAFEGISQLSVPFHKILIPLSAEENYSIQVIKTGKVKKCTQWKNILSPVIKADEANALQKNLGIRTSLIYPLMVHGKSIGMMIFSLSKSFSLVTKTELELLDRFTDICALAVQNAQLYSTLKDLTNDLQRANNKLKQADELKDEFVYVASHELRTPLTAIKNFLWLSLYKDKNELSPELKKNLKRAYISTERLIKLVKDMLTVSRIEGKRLVLNMEEIDLISVYKQIINEIQPIAEKEKIAFIFVPSKKKVIVYGDRIRIIEVMQNLLSNALKFTPEGGTITVSVESTEKYAVTRVSDTGFGIAKEDMPRLFSKFGRLGGSYKKVAESAGTGLGLYISKQIVEAHGGTISVASKVGRGTTFTFTIPHKANKS